MAKEGEVPAVKRRINIDAPRWEQRTFLGRLKYFFWITDYRTALVTTSKLNEAKELVEKYRRGEEPEGTTEAELWYAKKLTLSAFHPDSGELQNFIGRMSFQVPGGMIITAGMLQFYRSTGAVILWQWINQSFNALVNYTNRNANSPLTTTQMGVAYLSATGSAVVTAVALKGFLAKRASPLLQRFVPFVAVASANMVNIPLTRQSELLGGIGLKDDEGRVLTNSRYAATKGISQVVFSRITIAAPGMLLMPIVMETMEKRAWFRRATVFHLPFQTFMLGVFLTFMVPIGCALFPQQSTLSLERLKKKEPEKYEEVVKALPEGALPATLTFNKGL